MIWGRVLCAELVRRLVTSVPVPVANASPEDFGRAARICPTPRPSLPQLPPFTFRDAKRYRGNEAMIRRAAALHQRMRNEICSGGKSIEK
jgi:hypothetical protein